VAARVDLRALTDEKCEHAPMVGTRSAAPMDLNGLFSATRPPWATCAAASSSRVVDGAGCRTAHGPTHALVPSEAAAHR